MIQSTVTLKMDPEVRKFADELSIARRALKLACDRIADSSQQFHEANTPEGWADVYLEAAREGKTADEVIASHLGEGHRFSEVVARVKP